MRVLAALDSFTPTIGTKNYRKCWCTVTDVILLQEVSYSDNKYFCILYNVNFLKQQMDADVTLALTSSACKIGRD